MSNTRNLTGTLRIENGTLFAGRISFQIVNITSLETYEVTDDDQSKVAAWTACIFTLFGSWIILYIALCIAFGVFSEISPTFFRKNINPNAGQIVFILLVIGILLAGMAYTYFYTSKLKFWYILKIQTNAASFFNIVADNRDIITRVKDAIESAMHNPSNPGYMININNNTVEKIEANTTQVKNSPGANTIGGSATNVHQTSNVSITAQGLQDISDLIEIVERSSARNASLLKTHLETVRIAIAGGAAGKEEAKSAWSQFVQHVGQLAGAGNSLWELVARVGSLLA